MQTNLKSETLTPDELDRLKTVVAEAPTKAAAATALGIKNRGTLRTILGLGSGSPENVKSIRKHLNVQI